MEPLETIQPEVVHTPVNYRKAGIILAVLLFLAVMVSIFVPRERNPQEIRDEGQAVVTDGMTDSNSSGTEKGYSIRAMNNQVVIYSDDGTTYEETNIQMKDLPAQEQRRVKEGVYQVDEAALYDFLESYTS